MNNVDVGGEVVVWSEGFRKMTGVGGSRGEVFLVFATFVVLLAFVAISLLVFVLASDGGD